MSRPLRITLTAGAIIIALLSVYQLDARYRHARAIEVAEKFQLMASLRRSAMETYFATVRAEVSFWSVSERIHQSMLDVSSGWSELGQNPGAEAQRIYITENVAPSAGLGALDDAGDGSAYSAAHKGLHGLARDFVIGRGYYDFFLIDLDGNVIYSVDKELDFATNLVSGPYSNSGLGNLFRRLASESYNGEVLLTDFAPYAPSGDAPAIFVGHLMQDDSGRAIGVLALQLPSETIHNIMRFTAGMGESGETYLVGRDRLMRSDSRFSASSTALKTRVDTDTVAMALNGERGARLTVDYRGIEVLSAYDYLEFDGIRWAVMAEIDESELEQRVGSILWSLLAAAAALLGLLAATLWALRDLLGPADTESPLGAGIDVDGGL